MSDPQPLTKEEALVMYDSCTKEINDIDIPTHESFYKGILALICILLIFWGLILIMLLIAIAGLIALKKSEKTDSLHELRELGYLTSTGIDKQMGKYFFYFVVILVTCILVGVLGIPANKKRLQDAYDARDESIFKYRIGEVYELLPELSHIKITKKII